MSYTGETAVDIKTENSSVDFSEMLAEALQKEIQEKSVTLASSSPDDLSLGSLGLSSGLGIEQILLSSASSGEIGETEIAVFMLYMMMQSMDKGSDSSMLMSLMATMLSQLQSGGKSSAGGISAFSTPAMSDTGSVEVPAESWLPASPALVSDGVSRSAETLRRVIDQFNVENSLRYTPYKNNGSDTYCNIFVWDVTSALSCEIPHWVDSSSGAPRAYPNVEGAYELDANGVCDWLGKYGASYGWREVSAQEAQAYANEGKPAVTAWKNTGGGAGHVQIVCPSESLGYDETKGAAVAQSGSRNSSYTYVSDVFSKQAQSNIRYYVHE